MLGNIKCMPLLESYMNVHHQTRCQLTHLGTLGAGHVNTVHAAQPGEQSIQIGETPLIVQEHIVLQREAHLVLVAIHSLPGQPDGDGQLDGRRRRRLGLGSGGIGRAGEQDGHRGGGLGDAGALGRMRVRGVVVLVGGRGGLAAGAAVALFGTGAGHEAVHCSLQMVQNGPAAGAIFRPIVSDCAVYRAGLQACTLALEYLRPASLPAERQRAMARQLATIQKVQKC